MVAPGHGAALCVGIGAFHEWQKPDIRITSTAGTLRTIKQEQVKTTKKHPMPTLTRTWVTCGVDTAAAEGWVSGVCTGRRACSTAGLPRRSSRRLSPRRASARLAPRALAQLAPGPDPLPPHLTTGPGAANDLHHDRELRGLILWGAKPAAAGGAGSAAARGGRARAARGAAAPALPSWHRFWLSPRSFCTPGWRPDARPVRGGGRRRAPEGTPGYRKAVLPHDFYFPTSLGCAAAAASRARPESPQRPASASCPSRTHHVGTTECSCCRARSEGKRVFRCSARVLSGPTLHLTVLSLRLSPVCMVFRDRELLLGQRWRVVRLTVLARRGGPAAPPQHGPSKLRRLQQNLEGVVIPCHAAAGRSARSPLRGCCVWTHCSRPACEPVWTPRRRCRRVEQQVKAAGMAPPTHPAVAASHCLGWASLQILAARGKRHSGAHRPGGVCPAQSGCRV